MPNVELVSIGNIDASVAEFLAFVLSEDLGLECGCAGLALDPSRAYDSVRQQYNSMELLVDLYRLGAPKECKVLGIASVDLFVPVLTFVFGQAQLGNRAAVLSTYRLHQDFYGLPEDEDLFFHRCEKEAVHELGHTFGLVHCRDSECVMHLSNAIEQVDQKTAAFCEVCKERWEESVRQSGVRPSAELLRACEAHSGSGLDSLLERAGGANRRPAWFNPNGC